MRAVTIGNGVSLNATASQAPINLQSSQVSPPVYIGSPQQNVTCTNASPMVATGTLALANGTPVVLGGTAVPTGFTAGQVYYVVNTSGVTFQLSATVGGAAINSSSTGTAVTAFSPSANLGLGANAPPTSTAVDDESAAVDSPFIVGGPGVVVAKSQAGAGTTSFIVEGANDSMAPAGTPGAYTAIITIAGVQANQVVAQVASLPQYIRTRVVNGGADATLGYAYLLAD